MEKNVEVKLKYVYNVDKKIVKNRGKTIKFG